MRDLSNLSHPNPLAFWAAAYQRHCPPMLSFIHKKHTRDVHDMTEKESVSFFLAQNDEDFPFRRRAPKQDNAVKSQGKQRYETRVTTSDEMMIRKDVDINTGRPQSQTRTQAHFGRDVIALQRNCGRFVRRAIGESSGMEECAGSISDLPPRSARSQTTIVESQFRRPSPCQTAVPHCCPPKSPPFHRGIPGLPSSAEKTLQRCCGRGLDPDALPTWSERSRVAGGPTNHHTDTDTDCCATQVMRWPRSRPTTVDNGQAHSCRRRLLDRST